jgi:hypothetical protein
MTTLQQIKTASNRELAQWLREVGYKPEFINTASTIRDEQRRRDSIGRIEFKSAGATRKR